MKGVPIIGTTIGALTMPAVAACGTWVIGKVFMKHFASGGTLLDFNPPDYREFIKVQTTKFAARARDTASGPRLPQRLDSAPAAFHVAGYVQVAFAYPSASQKALQLGCQAYKEPAYFSATSRRPMRRQPSSWRRKRPR
jgi:hypothetical protein